MKWLKNIRTPQWIIFGFMVFLFIVAHILGIDLKKLLSESLVKFCRNGIMVLALIPMLKAGAGLNFGAPVGIVTGLIGMCMAIQFRLTGVAGFLVSVLVMIPIGVLAGIVYSLILDHVKGKEDIAAIFISYSLIPLMNFFWTVAPFTNREMLYPIGGTGLRPKISLQNYFDNLLDKWMVLKIGGISIPVGFLLIYALVAVLLVLFFKTRTGEAMTALGENELFSALSGIRTKRIRHLAIIMSTVLAGFAIITYAQSYGFVELYTGPSGFAFPAVSSILIGGYIGKKASVFQAMLGTYLYQTIYLLSSPIANAILIPELAEIVRMIITNGIILYAFLRQTERRRSHG